MLNDAEHQRNVIRYPRKVIGHLLHEHLAPASCCEFFRECIICNPEGRCPASRGESQQHYFLLYHSADMAIQHCLADMYRRLLPESAQKDVDLHCNRRCAQILSISAMPTVTYAQQLRKISFKPPRASAASQSMQASVPGDSPPLQMTGMKNPATHTSHGIRQR